MAELVGVVGVTHNPLLWRTMQPEPLDQGLADVAAGFMQLAGWLDARRPDAVLVIGTDHMTRFTTENMPAFLIGKAARHPAIFWNETREFGIPQMELEGDPAIAGGLLRGGLQRGFDLAYSDAMRLDHAFVVPYAFLFPGGGPPLIPLFTNCIAPPLPPAARFLQLGHMLRDAIEALPGAQRIAIVASGHLSVEVGGPRQFSGAPDPTFDRTMTELFAQGAVDELVERSTPEALTAAGNVTHQFMNFLVALGAAGGSAAVTAESVDSRFTASPFYAWEA
jgi:protocatechuate 4,5-dioxygenase, beta chain